ncbi:MAG: type VI secretion system tip protein TssI/VgrG [Pseudomonadota bacterium]
MSYLSERKYSFTASALPKDTFAVIDFSGEEGLSRTYRFDIGLVTENADIDLDAVMAGNAKFVIHREAHHDVPFSGILTAFEQQHAVDGYVFYRAVLVPRLWWLSLTHHNQIFLGKTVPDIVAAVLKDGGLTSMDYDFRLQGTYAPQEYVCQYDESHLDFIERWLAREGVYYFFEQMAGGERIVFTDTIIAHKKSRFGSHVNYSPPSGLDTLEAAESMQGFVCRQHLLPRRVLLKDYNYRKPSLEMIGTAEVDATGRGERFVYGEHFRTPEEGNRLAKIRAQALLCRKREFIGESTAPFVSPGFSFELKDHYRSEFNQQYLTLEMTHSGSQTGYLVSGIQRGLSDRERTVAYRNQFTAIPASVQFRPEKEAAQPKITGTLNARIDAAGSGKYAELDEQGRYKVILPFDMSGRKNGKASTWLRMIQPYAGSDHGMHFPLHKDAEVMLTFVEGNPDRPVIAGAAPNPETPSPVTGADQTMAKITTAGGNRIHMEDREGSQRILLHTPTAGTYVRLGSPNDPDKKSDHEKIEGMEKEIKEMKEEQSKEGAAGIKLYTTKGFEVQAGAKNEMILGEEGKFVAGNKNDVVVGVEIKLALALCLALEAAAKGSYGPEEFTLRGSHERAHAEEAHAAAQSFKLVQSQVLTAMETIRTVAQDVKAHGSAIKVHGQSIKANADDIEAHGSAIRTCANVILTHADRIEAHGNVIQAHGSQIKTAGNLLMQAGTHIGISGVTSSSSGTRLTQAGTSIVSAGMAMKDAPLIIHG